MIYIIEDMETSSFDCKLTYFTRKLVLFAGKPTFVTFIFINNVVVVVVACNSGALSI